jgi:hypothetical protein
MSAVHFCNVGKFYCQLLTFRVVFFRIDNPIAEGEAKEAVSHQLSEKNSIAER